MGRAIFLLLLSSVVFLGGGPRAKEFPDPQTLLFASRAAYQALNSYEAVVTMTIEASFASASLRYKIFFSFPFSRMEYESEEIFGIPRVVISVQDHQEGRAFVLYTNGEWEEIHDESLKEEVFLDAIAKEFLLPMDFEKVERGEFMGKPAWVLRGTGTPLGGIWGEITLWLEEETLFVRRIESKGFGFTATLTVEEFKPGVEIPHDLFQPPPPELVARRITVVPQGREILSSVWKKLSDLQSFIVRKRVKSSDFLLDEEQIVVYRHPFLRIESRSPQIPHFPSQLLRLEIHDFSSGFVYYYDAFEDSWEKEEIGPFAMYSSAAETAIAALMEAYRLAPPETLTVIGLKEETLRGRKTWRITARGAPGTDEPGPEWWVDQETLSILRYAMPEKVWRFEEEPRWEIEYADILSFEPNPEVPEELFAVPEDVPLRRPKLPEGLEFPWEKSQGISLEGWDTFSFESLEEAKAQEKRVVLFFTAEWCDACHALEAGPLQNPQVQELLQPLARLVVDLTFPKGEAKKVADRYNVRALPTLLFLDAQGNELGRISGYRSTSSLLREIKKILEGGEK